MTTTASAPGLPPVLSHALAAKNYDTLTEVQDAMLAPELEGRDLLVSARTGSGKTVAFGLAIGPELLGGEDCLPRAEAPLALIVAPTRELAMQVARELSWLYREAGASIATCVGGMDMRQERGALARGAHIVVGTPGRLVDHIGRGSLDLTDLRAVVLDEADEMLNLGFREELETILDACPDGRRTLMFSATVAGGISKLAARYQKDALRITAGGPTRQHDDIAYRALVTAQHDAEKAIINTLLLYEAENAIVFCSTRAAVSRLTSRLANRGFAVVAISGELSQAERTNALQAMRDGRARVCVATDVAARGIDLPGLELVIHADLPKNREGLLHRSGRTGRAGRKGTSVLIVPPRATRRIEGLLESAKVKAEWTSPPSAEDVDARNDERLLSDPVLTEGGEIGELARTLAARHSHEAIAEALVRLYRRGRSAPEEIAEVGNIDTPRQRPRRDEIEDAVWVTLSVGKANRAEPRWLLPMLCKQGGLKKEAIGAIRVRDEVTYVQLDAEGASEFLTRMENGDTLEDGISLQRADGPPPAEPRRNGFKDGPRKPFGKKDGAGQKPRDARPRTEKDTGPGDEGRPPAKFKRKPRSGEAPRGPKRKFDGPKGAKPGKKPFKARKTGKPD
jgi:ATP-dependent RNA helicase DeaD